MYRIKRFSALTNSDNNKLSSKDLNDLNIYRNLNEKGRKEVRERLMGVDYSLNDAKRAGIAGSIAGGLVGGLATRNLKGVATGALIGGTTWGGGTYVGHKVGLDIRRKLEEKSDKYRKGFEKQLDLMNVADGLMTESDFAKKWYTRNDYDEIPAEDIITHP